MGGRSESRAALQSSSDVLWLAEKPVAKPVRISDAGYEVRWSDILGGLKAQRNENITYNSWALLPQRGWHWEMGSCGFLLAILD